VLGVIGVLVFLALIVGVATAANHYSGRAMDKLGEAKSASHAVGWYVVWIALAVVCGLVGLYGLSTANKASQSYQPTPTPYQTR
jgi:hypothetical protein